MPKSIHSACFAYQEGYGLFPVKSVDFENGIVYDFDGVAHNIDRIAHLIIGDKRGNIVVQKKEAVDP